MALEGSTPEDKTARIPIAMDDMKINPTKDFVKDVDKFCSGPVLPDFPKSPAVNIAFHDLSYHVPRSIGKGTKTILKSVSGQFRSGELTALMGPSGAGKSSLMNIVAGFKTQKVDGDILVNGRERKLRSFRKISCYIMQRDELSPYLSVVESMMFAANLKLGDRFTADQKRAIVNEIIENLGLEGVADTWACNLSGGERKRLAIASELVNNPPVMFFDEPTSGLDSASCLQCISLLKRLAQSGRTVVCVIHQPSSMLFETFDRLYLLAEGQCIYRGLTGRLVDFLASISMNCPTYYNPADYIIDIAAGRYGYMIDQLVNRIQNGRAEDWSREAKTAVAYEADKSIKAIGLNGHKDMNISPPVTCETQLLDADDILPAASVVSSWTQFRLLLYRSFISSIRDLTLTRLRLSIHLVVGLLTGLLYLGIGNDASQNFSNVGLIFFNQLFLMTSAMMTTVLTFPLLMPNIQREHLNNWYSLKVYYAATTVSDLPFQTVYPFFYLVIVYFMSDQPPETGRFFMFCFMGFMTSLVAQSIGLFIGAATPIQIAVILGPVSMAPAFLFSGFFATFHTIPKYMHWICYTVYVRYGFEGSILAIYGFDRPDLNCPQPFCYFKSPAKYLDEFDMRHSLYWIDAVVLVAYYLIVRFLTYFVLRWKVRSH